MKNNKLDKVKKCVLVHYSEIGLKGKNRHVFENQLIQNMKTALSDLFKPYVERVQGRFYFEYPTELSWETIRERLKNIFGIAYFAPAFLVPQEMKIIEDTATRLMTEQSFESFRVTTKRANKNFPLNSSEINQRVGALIQQQTGSRVDLTTPEKTCYIEIFDQSALIYTDRIPGLRGLPVGVSEKAVSLLSAGIDSPVASWKMMKRGVKIIFVHFHSMPYTSPASIRNVEHLLNILVQYQFSAKLYLIPFLKIQEAIMTNAVPAYRVVHYRRAMYTIAEMVALREKASALVTGESVGQVASQTLSNMRVINEVTRLPVLRPLAGDDKEEIIQIAKNLKTFEISIEPYEDCCTLFVPRNPVTKADPQIVQETEEKLPLKELYQEALENTEIKIFKFPL